MSTSTNSKNLLITIGNVYLDNNVFDVNLGEEKALKVGNDYLAERSEKVLGGSAVNFAMQAQNLGSKVAFLGNVGDDDEGVEIKKLLTRQNIISDLVTTTSGDQTSVAFNAIFSGSGEFVGFHWGNASRNLSPDQIDVAHPLFDRANAVYFGGTAKQELIFNELPSLFQKLKTLDIKIFIDPNRFPIRENAVKSGIFLKALDLVDCYLPNEDELKQTTGKESVDEALEFILQKGAKMIAVKLGAKGCRIKTKSEDISIPGFKITPVSTVGAGDSFNAGFITQHLANRPLEECGIFGNACAALKVSQNKFASSSEIERFLKNQM